MGAGGVHPGRVPVVDRRACDRTKACLKQGLILFNDDDGPGAIWVRGLLMNRPDARR